MKNLFVNICRRYINSFLQNSCEAVLCVLKMFHLPMKCMYHAFTVHSIMQQHHMTNCFVVISHHRGTYCLNFSQILHN